MSVDDCCSWSGKDASDKRPPNSLCGRQASVTGSCCCGRCGTVRISTLMSLCGLETVDGTSRSDFVAELSIDILLVCRRPLTPSLFESCCDPFADLCCGCCEVLLAAVTFGNLAPATCDVVGLTSTDVSARCVALVAGVEVLVAVPPADNPASCIHHQLQASTIMCQLLIKSHNSYVSVVFLFKKI